MIDYEGMILARQEAIEIWEDDSDSSYLNEEWIDVMEEVINEQRKRKEAAVNQTDPVRSQGIDNEGLWSDPVRV